MKVIELLNRIANDEGVPIKIKYNRKIYEYQEGSYDYLYYVENNGTMLFLLTELFNSSDNILDILNIELEEVPLIEEEKELHANEIVFNCDNNKRECVITLDENDLGIDKLHMDNCYFYKENGKWYVKKYDFKTIKLEEDKKIEPIEWNIDDDNCQIYYNGAMNYVSRAEFELALKINEIIDYLKSKGE